MVVSWGSLGVSTGPSWLLEIEAELWWSRMVLRLPLKSRASTRFSSPAQGGLREGAPLVPVPSFTGPMPSCLCVSFSAWTCRSSAVVWGLPIHTPHPVLFSHCLPCQSVFAIFFLLPSHTPHTSTEVHFFFSLPKSSVPSWLAEKCLYWSLHSAHFFCIPSPIFFSSSSLSTSLLSPTQLSR